MTRAETIEAALKDWIEARNGGYERERIAYEMAMIAIAEPADPAPASDVEKAKDLEYLIEQAAEAEEFCGKICGHSPTDTIREVEGEALTLGHGLMIAINPFRDRLAALAGKGETK